MLILNAYLIFFKVYVEKNKTPGYHQQPMWGKLIENINGQARLCQ